MSKINQIQDRIHELSGDVFQKVADAYLHRKGYSNLNPLGSVIGADKVRKGTPDSLCTLPNGKYAFFEYTTHKSKELYKKIIEDLEKCFDEGKTGIAVDLIDEVVYCHTSLLSTKEEKGIRELCQEKGVNINIFGIGPLSFDLYQKYPGIARDLLGIEVDTGQVITIEDFVSAYNKSAVATPLDTQFHFREEEVSTIVNALETTDLVVISGRSGVGKSRMALECCHKYKQLHSNYEIKCIFNRGVSIFEDLAIHFSDSKPFLIFVDDANRLNQLDYVLQWIHKQEFGRKIKIIATVRDYAIEKIRNIARQYGGGFELEINPLNEEQISNLIEEEFEIKNDHYLKRISEISKGNPRLAIMAAKVAKRENNLQSIRDVTMIYEEYYESIKKDIEALDDVNIKKAAGIVSFFRTIDFSNNDQMISIEEAFSISRYEFWEAVKKLHDIEVFDMYENEAVRVSDQVLATYLFYLTVFKEGIIDFSVLLNNFFPNRKQLIIDAINPVLNSLNTEDIMEEMSSHVKNALAIAKENGDEETTIELYSVFWFIDRTSTLLYVRDSMKGLESEEFDYKDFQIKKNNNIPKPTLLSILSAFVSSEKDNFKIANELLLSIFDKRPSLAYHVYTILTETFGFDVESHLFKYEHQHIVIDVLWNRIQKNKNNDALIKLFVKVADNHLKTKFESMGYQGKTVLIRTFELYNSDSLIQLRTKIWNYVFELYKDKELRSEVLELIYNYSSSRLNVCTTEIIQSDYSVLFPFIVNSFDKESYLECSILQEYLDLLKDHKIEFDIMTQEKFKNETYTLSELLFWEPEELDGEEFDYIRRTEMRKIKIREFFREYTQVDYLTFFKQCIDIKTSGFLGDRDEYRFHESIFEVFGALLDRDPTLGKTVFNEYLNLNDPLSINSFSFLAVFTSRVEDYKSLSRIIRNSHVNSINKWIYAYLFYLPKDNITEEDADVLLTLYKEASPEHMPYQTDYLLKYLDKREKLITTVVKILLERTNVNKQFAGALEMIFNPHTEINKNLILLFKDDIDVLKQAYLVVLECSNHYVDYKGSNLDKILELDSRFMLEFIKRYEDLKNRHYHVNNDYACIWLHEEYDEIMEEVVLSILEYKKNGYSYREPLLKDIFLHNRKENVLVIERQDKFLKKIITMMNSNIELMRMIFHIISHFSTERKLSLLQDFLIYNQDYSHFRKLPLEESLRSWSGSEVPILQERIAYFELVLGLLNSVDLLEHKHEIEGRISYLRDRIEQEKKRDFLDD
ncbi:nSTAND3 domain-containing NTPase [Paenibacillus massiliensis]|uniref:nSTAND3 domain-containing NTPase n=1 Tax=Paenibacillus massiliensis TaxID=225917 RepID=UPI00036DDF34|nr:ATP-binding protein [Paenibacillus massiliensis]